VKKPSVNPSTLMAFAPELKAQNALAFSLKSSADHLTLIPSVFKAKSYLEASLGVDHLGNGYASWSSQNIDWLNVLVRLGH
jgi:hypothetical protein